MVVYHHWDEIDIELAFWQYFEIFKNEEYGFLLDSALADEKLGRYSFMGANPAKVYKAFVGEEELQNQQVRVEITRSDATSVYHTANLFEDLRTVWGNPQPAINAHTSPPFPFTGGAIGYLGYEAGSLIENVPVRVDGDDLPVACLLFIDTVLVHCHTTDKTWISAWGRGTDDEVARKEALLQKEDLVALIKGFEPARERTSESEGQPALQLQVQHNEASYCKDVEAIQQMIQEGRTYEVCLTHQFSCPQMKPAWSLYQNLREINPAPFAAYLQLGDVQVVCSSPERFLHLGKDRVIESRPIKGTRPRGETTLHDIKLEDELRNSEKDRAENLMIVDLVRNDLSRVAEMGSVHVPQLLKVERYATVLQLVSAIKGTLREDCDVFDLIEASFPGGSMTGAPKIEAMKIIHSLEKTRRGIYSGAIGYLDYAGEMDLNIVIRSIVVRNGRCEFSVGGAVVSDSDPKDEYRETLDKAKALVAALRA